MARIKGDSRTADLLSWLPPEPVQSFDTETVRAASLHGALCRALKEALKSCDKTREQIAEEMSEYLGEDVSKNMLDAYASEARDEHIINVIRFIALISATRDQRLLNWIAEMFGWAVIDQRYLPAINVALLADKKEEIERQLQVAQRNLKNGSAGL